MATLVTKLLTIKGLVQGVGFRFNTMKEARNIHGLQGWVRNLANGDVEVLIQGPVEKVAALIAWCKIGPSGCRIESVIERSCPIESDLCSFEVRS